MTEEEKQLELLYDAHADALYRLCFFKTSNTDLAEDLVQETFTRFWDQITKKVAIKNEKALLFQIARNLIIDYYRKKKTESLETLQDEGFEPSDASHENIVHHAEKNIALELIHKLDEKYRDVVYLRLVEEMSFKEIAKMLSITSNNATVTFHRGKEKLERLLAEKHG